MAILFVLLLPLLMAGFFGLIFNGGQRAVYVPGMLGLGCLWAVCLFQLTIRSCLQVSS